jgi:hypothetical protein
MYVNKLDTGLANQLTIGTDTICIWNDSIAIKFFNNDAFGSYSAYYGEFKFKRNRLKLKENDFLNVTSSLSQEANKDNEIRIRLLWANNTEMKYGVAQIKKTTKDERAIYQSDVNGVITLDDAYSGLDSINVYVYRWGFTSKHKIKFKTGVTYTIKSSILNDREISALKPSLKIKYLKKTNDIKVSSYGRKKRTIQLNRIGDCDSPIKMVLR